MERTTGSPGPQISGGPPISAMSAIMRTDSGPRGTRPFKATGSSRKASSDYAARMELEVQAGAGQQPEARDEFELEL
jgi:hypothetical protein